MSRKITDATVSAFISGRKLTMGYTHSDGSGLYLHGNLIAVREGSDVFISSAGWMSNTTKERLNGIPGVSISQKKGEWFLNGQKWDGKGPYFNGKFIKV